MECDLCNGRIFSANCGLEVVKGIWDAIDLFVLGLIDLCGIVNCDAIGIEVSGNGEFGAIELFWICNFC